MTATADQMTTAVCDAGCRMTPQRSIILNYLAGRHDHPSARQIFEALQHDDAGVSLATVYNTLTLLVDLGLITVIEYEAADNRYDTNVTPHINLVCVECGRIMDLQSSLPVSPREIRRTLGFEVTDLRLEYLGICAACRAGA